MHFAVFVSHLSFLTLTYVLICISLCTARQVSGTNALTKALTIVVLITSLSLCDQKSVEGWKGAPSSGEMRLQLSTGDMADDEREDSSTEPEPDYELEEAEEGVFVGVEERVVI